MTQRVGSERTSWHVVVAEDNDDHALLIEMALKNVATIPVEITRAHNGDEAVEKIFEIVPDLILLDLRMPGRDGHEVLEAVKGDPEARRIPIAVLTSSDRDEDIARSYGLGGNHFITKPDNPYELEASLRSLLRNVSEMGSIRRGAGSVDASAKSAVTPASLSMSRIMPWLAVAGVLLLLFVFSRIVG
jgi:CheY-like chemotaxis protein